MAISIDAAAFQQWLEQRADGTIFGQPLDVEGMALTGFLRESSGNPYLWGTLASVVFLNDKYETVEQPYPDWAMAFAALCSYERTDIGKEMALRILALCRR